MAQTQNQMIQEYLEKGHRITPLEALNMFGCFRLGARIADLKKQGMNIKTDIVHDKSTGKHWASYYVPREIQEKPCEVYDCYQSKKAQELAERGELF